MLGPWLGFVVRCLDGAEVVHFASDFFRLDDATVLVFYTVAAHSDLGARCEKLGEVFGLLRTDANDGAIGQQCAAKFAFRTEQREPDGSLKLHLLMLDLRMFAVVIRTLIDDLPAALFGHRDGGKYIGATRPHPSYPEFVACLRVTG